MGEIVGIKIGSYEFLSYKNTFGDLLTIFCPEDRCVEECTDDDGEPYTCYSFITTVERAVVIDDIDRLTTSEIRDIFKLVRLTANFPNVIYILAFDRVRVEEALAEQGIPGRDYLEKILQVGIDLPEVPAHVLNKQVFHAIEMALSSVDNIGPFDKNAWPDIYMEVIRPLLRNMRDVRRYVAALHGTVRELGGQIALTDVLALEAIRVFLPDVFQQMHGSVEGLTTTYDLGYGDCGDMHHT